MPLPCRREVCILHNRMVCGVDCHAEVGESGFGGMKTAVRGVVLSDGCCVRVVFRVAY